jgi:hypothetical protein
VTTEEIEAVEHCVAIGVLGDRFFDFNSFIAQFHRDELAKEMPLCLRDTGGSIWIKKVSNPEIDHRALKASSQVQQMDTACFGV